PDPDLLGFGSPEARPALERLGEDAWTAALDYLFDEALRRPVGTDTYPELRERFFGPGGRPAPAPEGPSSAEAVLKEVRDRLFAYQFNTQHPGSFSYFTPPPLPVSIAGEILSMWMNQGVDVWHAGP